MSACSARIVYFECSRVTTKCGLSSHDFFPRDITPPVTGEFAKLNIFHVTGKIYHVTVYENIKRMEIKISFCAISSSTTPNPSKSNCNCNCLIR